MKRLLFAFLSFVPAVLFAQSTIRGIVVDSLTNEPLPSATVYVNGTTQGTTTDNDGRFELKEVSFPATVVFSFVGYKPKALDVDRNPGELTVCLRTNDELPEIEVSGKTNKIRKEDMDYFKTMFLGDDRWGKRATIKNENVLMVDKSFQTTYYTRQIGRSSFVDHTLYSNRMEIHEKYVDTVKVVSSVFTAWAYEPLIIDLPMLGYELYVDLVKFTVITTNSVSSCDILGYFYYKPYDKVNKLKAQSIEENRMRAYYGSSQHFLRSFAQNRLTENGFIVTMPESVVMGKKTISMQVTVDAGKYSESVGDNLIEVNGLKDKKIKIRYYHRNDGSPLNFNEKGKGLHRYSESWISFLQDKCTYLKEGIVTDNSIRFTGDISKKRVAACLPDDYCPIEDIGKINVRDSVDYASEMIRFVDNIRQFNSLFPQEKVYLEFDNTAYFQGENIWFKAFVTSATTLERAPSGVLYVDFVAPTGQIILQQKLKVEAGQTDGAIPLLDAGTQQTREKRGIVAYPSGFYEIRAYTQNMLDFSPEAVFSRVIPVYTQPKYVGEYDRSHVVSNEDNPLVDKLRGESQEKDKDLNVTFYPEGGDLIRGVPNRVAFKATGSDAFGIDALLVFGLGDSARTVHDGMGSFIITPDGYNAVDIFPTSNYKHYFLELPRPVKSGYSMMSDMLSDSLLQVSIWRTQDLIGEQTALAVTCRGDVVYFEEIKDVESSRLNIDCSGWPVGVCRITLFNKEGRILSSRSIFHNSAGYHSPSIAVSTDSMSRQSCDREVLEFMLTDQAGNPFQDRFCLSVRDATDYGGGHTDNLQTNLLLSSDLRGYIHDPAWYLESNDQEHREALNLLTMVQGWERYEWQTMAGITEFEEKHRIEEGLTMNGWILSYRNREPVSDINIYASLMPDNDKTLFESFEYQTDSTGYFGFDLSDFYGKSQFTIHVMSKDKNGETKYDENKRIRFDRADRPDPRPYFKQETDLTHNDHRPYDYKVDYTDFDLTPAQRKKLGRMIDDVDIEEQGEKRRFIDYDTFTSFEVEEDAELELDQGDYTTDLRGYFMEKNIRLAGDEEKFDIEAESGSLNDIVESDGGSFAMDGIEPYYYVHNTERYMGEEPGFRSAPSIDMIDIKSIIIFDHPMHIKDIVELIPLEVEYRRKHADIDWFSRIELSNARFNLVDIQIKNDRQLLFDWEIRNLGRRSTTVKGFTKPVQFYSPVYPDGPIEGNIDSRRTLYWNPNVITDEDGRASVEFYNNSFTRKFTINAAGITASGIPYILNQSW